VALEELVEYGTGYAAFEAKAAPPHLRLGDLRETAKRKISVSVFRVDSEYSIDDRGGMAFGRED
jgi:hypothetical protein